MAWTPTPHSSLDASGKLWDRSLDERRKTVLLLKGG